jgi:hypothetical protein
MPEAPQRRILKLVVASPGDVMPERKCLDSVVSELNKSIASHFGLYINVLRWEVDSYPGFHLEGPQGLIDELFKIEESDILVGIFWKRFGTPTHGVESGTEHEFNLAYEAWKSSGGRRPHIMMYFNKKAYTPKNKAEAEQWAKVLEFKERFPKEGLGWSYKSTTEFEHVFRSHLTNYLLQNVGQLGGQSYTIVHSTQDLFETNQRIVNQAQKMLYMTGSRSRDAQYLQAIETQLAAKPGLNHYRVLFGPPHHQILKDHLAKLLQLRNPNDRSQGYKTIHLGLYANTLKQFETFILGNEREALVLLPSFTSMGNFDTGIIFSDPVEVESLKRFVQELYSASEVIETVEKIASLQTVKD